VDYFSQPKRPFAQLAFSIAGHFTLYSYWEAYYDLQDESFSWNGIVSV